MKKHLTKKPLDGGARVRRNLIERNLPLVICAVRKFEDAGVEIEDLISIGTIGLIKAINTFRPDEDVKLAPYVSQCIENEISAYLIVSAVEVRLTKAE